MRNADLLEMVKPFDYLAGDVRDLLRCFESAKGAIFDVFVQVE